MLESAWPRLFTQTTFRTSRLGESLLLPPARLFPLLALGLLSALDTLRTHPPPVFEILLDMADWLSFWSARTPSRFGVLLSLLAGLSSRLFFSESWSLEFPGPASNLGNALASGGIAGERSDPEQLQYSEPAAD